MTDVPVWADGPLASLRTIPGEYKKPEQVPWLEIKKTADLMLNVFIGKIAIALGGISILGWKPLDFLAEWGQKRIDDAVANYQAALEAQSGANWANTQLSLSTAASLAAGVSGGISITTQFTGSSSDDLGAGFTLMSSDGPGAGEFGLSGTGQAVWKKSGGNIRRKIFQHTTQLATDYQAIYTIVAAKPDKTQLLGSDAHTYLIGRMNSAATSFIWMTIGQDTVGIGQTVSGTWSNMWDSAPITLAVGDQFAFLLGTDTSDYQFLVQQNGVTRLSVTQTSAMGSSYRYVGAGARATSRSVFTDQTKPASLEMWAAADRLKSTY